LKHDIEIEGLNVIVFADWYNVEAMKKIKFFDENTHQWWTPATGGANIPALNDLLEPYGIAFGDRIYNGEFEINSREHSAWFSSGTSIVKFPIGGSLVSFYLNDKTEEILGGKIEKVLAPVLGLYPTKEGIKLGNSSSKIVVFGDSSCLDDANKRNPCFWLLKEILQFIERGPSNLKLQIEKPLEKPMKETSLPTKLEGNDLYKYSKVIGQRATCKRMDFKRYNQSNEEIVEIVWEELATPTTQRSNGMLRGGVSSRELNGNFLLQRGLFFPYLIGFVLFLLVVGFLLKRKSDKSNGSQPV